MHRKAPLPPPASDRRCITLLSPTGKRSGARSRLDPISRTARDELKVFQAHDIRREDFDTPQKGGLNRRA